MEELTENEKMEMFWIDKSGKKIPVAPEIPIISKENTTIVSILGEQWEILEGTKAEFPGLESCDGYTDSSVRRVVVDSMKDKENDPDAKADLKAYKQSVVRHEVIHAFLEESGLSSNTGSAEHWATNEEMVDWIAIQLSKIYQVLKKIGAV